MNALFRKHFWIIKLVGIALFALVVAGVVADFAAGKLFILPAARSGKVTEIASTDQDFGRLPMTANASEIPERRVFHLEGPELPAPVEVPKPPDEVKTDGPKADGELEQSQLPINLLGTFVASLNDYSYATLQIEGENKIASVGSEYLDGKAKVVKIAPGHIVLREDAHYTYVKLWGDKPPQAPAGAGGPGKGPPAIGRPPPVSAAHPPSDVAGANAPTDNPPSTNDEIAAGISKTGAYDYDVSRSMIDKQLADMQKLQQDARVIPHYKDKDYAGFKLVGVRPGSLYRALGIRSGDVITSINGDKIDSPNKALQLFESLKNSSDIAVEIERRGQPKTLSYKIK